MPAPQSDYFGSDAQIALLRRGRAAYDLYGQDQTLFYYGRTVGLVAPGPQAMDRLAGLITLQGNSSLLNVAQADVAELTREALQRGLTTTRYMRWISAENALQAARALLRDHPLPPDLSVHYIDAKTPDETLAELASVALACGVLPPSGAVLRGICKPGLGIVALDRTGRGVACAGAASILHPDHPDGRRQCWWGMLATLPERRGERLALILGAMALLACHERYGYTEILTGVEPGNTLSEKLCARLGLYADGNSVMTIADPAQLPGGRMTK